MVRHSNQDAVDEATFETLVLATDDLPEPRDAEALFILFAAGRLGMRGGEISHFRSDWVDDDRQLIQIPYHEPCTCSYCWTQSEQSASWNDESADEIFAGYWNPKTENSVRAIPFDFNERIQTVVETFCDEFDGYEHSRVSVNRRVSEVAEAAGIDPTTVYPHALRATAATWHAYRGVPTVALQSLMGWAKLDTAQKYIRLSGGATADALRSAHSD